MTNDTGAIYYYFDNGSAWVEINYLRNTGGTVTGNVAVTGTVTVTSASAVAVTVGRLGATTPAFTVDASTASQVAGFKVVGAATGGTVALVVTDSGTDASLTLNAKGTGTIGIGSVSTGRVTITPVTTITGSLTLSAALVYGGVTLSNAVTGTGNMVLSASPTFTGTVTTAAISATTLVTSSTAVIGSTLQVTGAFIDINRAAADPALYFTRTGAGASQKYIQNIAGVLTTDAIFSSTAGLTVTAGTTAVQALTATTVAATSTVSSTVSASGTTGGILFSKNSASSALDNLAILAFGTDSGATTANGPCILARNINAGSGAGRMELYSTAVTGGTRLLELTLSNGATFAAGITATTGTFSSGAHGTGNVTPSGNAGVLGYNSGTGKAVVYGWNGGGAAYRDLVLNDTVTITGGGAGATTAFDGPITIKNTVNVVSPTSPNRTVTMSINGTTYYLAAKTTND
jgi:hypothetical protein